MGRREPTREGIKIRINALGDISGPTAIDVSDGAGVTCRLTGNTTFNISGWDADGEKDTLELLVEQDGFGGHTVSFPDATLTSGSLNTDTSVNTFARYIVEKWGSGEIVVYVVDQGMS